VSRYKYQSTAQDGTGRFIPSATITVYLANSTTLATVYAAASGGSAVTNSAVTSDSTTGWFEFYVDDSEYTPNQRFKIILSKTGYTSQTWDYLKIIPDETYEYYADATATDQGAATTRADRSLKDLIDTISTATATVVMPHSGTGNTTTHTLTTSETVPANVKLSIQFGAIIDGAGTLTINSDFDHPRTQCFGSSITVEGLSFAYPEWFGAAADPSTPTDDLTEFASAFTALGAEGGSVVIDEGSQYYLATTLTVPVGCSLVGKRTLSTMVREASDMETYGSLIYLNSAAKITLSLGSSISGINLLRYGITLPTDKAEVDNYAGTGVYLGANAHGAYISNMTIVGFATGIDNYISGDVTDPASFRYAENVKIERVLLDNTTGIRIGNSLATLWINDVESRPYSGLGGDENADDLERTGYGIWVAGESDSVHITNAYSYGWAEGIRVDSAHDVTLLACGADHGTVDANTPIGFNIISDESTFIKLIGCHTWGAISVGIVVNNVAAANSDTVVITGGTFSSTAHVIQIVDGNAIITGNVIRGATNAIRISADADQVIISNNIISDVTTAISSDAGIADTLVQISNNFVETFTNYTDNLELPQFTDSDATPSVANHNQWRTNTTGVTITRFDYGYAGQEITIVSKGAIVYDTSSADRIIGSSVDITTAAGDTTTWVCETGGTTTSVWRLKSWVDVSQDNKSAAEGIYGE